MLSLAEARYNLSMNAPVPFAADSTLSLPLIGTPISCGFPSPADEYIENSLDLNQHLIQKPAATFFIRAKGDSMIGAGIHSGDLLIIDRSVSPRHNHIVVAVVNGEFTLKRLYQKDGQVRLLPENPAHAPIEIPSGASLEIWGIAVHCVHSLL